jgi:hypothetical protein
MRNTISLTRLNPSQAIAFSEKQYERFLKQAKDLKEQGELNLQLYRHGENEFYTAVPLLRTSLPFAEIKVITVEPDRIFASIESEIKPIREALKKNKAFKRVLKNIPVWELTWKYSFTIDEFEEIKKIDYPIFYVILNNSNEVVEIPV